MEKTIKNFIGDSFKTPPPKYSNTTLSQLFRIKVVQIEMILDRGYHYHIDILDTNPDINNRIKQNTWEISLAGNARETREQRLNNDKYADIKLFEDYYNKKAEEEKISGKTNFVGAMSNLYIKDDINDNGEKYNRILYVLYLSVPSNKKKLSREQAILVNNTITEFNKFFVITDLMIIGEAPFSSQAGAQIKDIYVQREDGVTIKVNYEFFLQKNLTYNPTKHIFYDEHRILTREEMITFLKNNTKDGRNIILSQLPAINVNDIIMRYFGAKLGDVVEIKSRGHLGSIIPETLDYKIVNNKKLEESQDENKNENVNEEFYDEE